MLFLLKKIISALILPPASLILLAFAGLWICKKHPKSGRTVSALALTTLFILSLPVTSNALLQSLETAPPISEAHLKEIQVIVILGGGKNKEAPEFLGHDTDNAQTLQRLRYGAYLQKLTGKPILVTGGNLLGERSEGEAMKEALERDFNAKNIWTEEQSLDTAENAILSAAVLNEHSVQRIALVSQAWHLPRATELFETQGITVYPAPTGYTHKTDYPILKWLPQSSSLNDSTIALKEYLGLLANKFQ